jgi:K(+)-stimulated pyrophosphate-energized sodium pump
LPIAFGYTGQEAAEMLGGYMAGVAVSGVLWAIFQNNAGGAWDNAKKSFEAGVMIDGEMTYKGSEAHKAAVTGDTVGDPFKDTSGPSMNILIKLTCLVGLVIAPILGGGHESHDAGEATEEVVEVRQEVKQLLFKDIDVLLQGTVSGQAKSKMKITSDDSGDFIIISFASEKYNGTFSSLEVDTDGTNFDAYGMVSMNGEELDASTNFHLDKEGSISEFVILFE